MSRSHASRIELANCQIMASGNLDVIADFFSPDYVIHATTKSFKWKHNAIRRFVCGLRDAFPDLRVDVEILVQEKDRVAWQRTLRGTQRGDYMGFPACRRQVTWRDMITSRFADGLITEDWVISDLAERLLKTRKK